MASSRFWRDFWGLGSPELGPEGGAQFQVGLSPGTCRLSLWEECGQRRARGESLKFGPKAGRLPGSCIDVKVVLSAYRLSSRSSAGAVSGCVLSIYHGAWHPSPIVHRCIVESKSVTVPHVLPHLNSS